MAATRAEVSACCSDDAPDTFAEADPYCALAFAPGAQRDLVAVLQEAPRLAARKIERLLSAAADFQQRTETLFAVRREGAGADQVARLEVAAVRGVVRHDLCGAPVHGRISS